MANKSKYSVSSKDYKPGKKKISAEKLAKFVQDYAVHGNAKAAVIKVEGRDINQLTAQAKASRWLKRPDVQAALQYVNKRLAEGSTVAVDRIVSLVGDENPRVALDASKYLVDQAHGKALQRTETQTVNLNIDTVLDMAI